MNPAPAVRLLVIPVLVLTVVLAFFPALSNGFVNYDDPAYVVLNPAIRSLSWSRVRSFFLSPHQGLYLPGVLLSYSLEYHCFGLDPFVFHLTNLVLHVINVLLVFGLVLLLVDDPATALLTALFYGIHPMRVESVAWVTERKDVLFTLFSLASLGAYLLHFRTSRPAWYAASLLAFLLALLCKGSAVTLPAVILTFEVALLRDRRPFSAARVLPFILLGAVFAVLTVAAIAPHSGTVTDPRFSLLVACYSLVFYVARTFLPVNLYLYHPYPAETVSGLPWEFMAAPFGLALLLGVWGLAARKSALALVAGAWFGFTILPLLQWVRVGPAIVGNWGTYLPGIGLTLLFALGVRRAGEWLESSSRPGFVALGALLLLFAAVWMVGETRARCRLWSDSVTLWNDVIAREPSHLAYVNRGQALHEQGRLDEARADLERALAGNASSPVAWNALGRVRRDLGNASGALSCFEAALRLDPSSPDPHGDIGLIHLGAGNWTAAADALSRAIALAPESAAAWNNRATAYRELGRPELSLQDLDRAASLMPDSGPIHLNLALTLARVGRREAAREALAEARRLGLRVPAGLAAQIEP